MPYIIVVMKITLPPEEKQELEILHSQEKNRRKADRIKSGRIKDAIATKPLKQPSSYSALKTHWVSSSLKPFLGDC
jgi:hypothetical protein